MTANAFIRTMITAMILQYLVRWWRKLRASLLALLVVAGLLLNPCLSALDLEIRRRLPGRLKPLRHAKRLRITGVSVPVPAHVKKTHRHTRRCYYKFDCFEKDGQGKYHTIKYQPVLLIVSKRSVNRTLTVASLMRRRLFKVEFLQRKNGFHLLYDSVQV